MGLWQDLQFAVRLLVKDKWFSLVAALALSLGIGVNAAVFTFVNAVLIRGLPFANPDEILAISGRDLVRDQPVGLSYLDFLDLRTAASFRATAAFDGSTMNVSDEGRAPERYNGVYISADGFRIIGQAPILGRDFLPEDDRPGAAPVVLLGNGVWRQRYGGDASIVGRTIRVNDLPSVIIGVMAEGFRFPLEAEVWQPLAQIRGLDAQPRNARGLDAFGRLAEGVSREQAQTELATIGRRMATDHPDTNKDILPQAQTFNERQNGGPIRAVFLSLLGAVGFVLLIACANVANLLLARSANRSREIAVRVSIGATRWRIVRQLLIESVLLALVSGIVGLAFSLVGIRMFDLATADVGRPSWIQFTMDGRVFAYFALICLGTGVLFGLAPALHVSKTDVNEILKEGGRSGSAGMRVRRWSGALVIAEIALTLALLAGAGFMMRNFLNMYRMDVGVDTSRLLTMQLSLPERKYPAIEQRLAFYDRLQERLAGNPRMRAVAVASNAPMGGGFGRLLSIDGRTETEGQQPPRVTAVTVDPRYFETIGIAPLRGRGFNAADGRPGQEHAIVNARFAQLHFGQDDPIGRRITLRIDLGTAAPPAGGIPVALTLTIIGVVPNVRQDNVQNAETDPIAYVPYRMDPRSFMMLLARTDGDPAAVTAVLREEMRAIDPDLPLYNIRSMDDVLARQRWPFRIFGTMFAVFAFIALMLSAVGLYAVTAYSVTQRTQEIGVRSALGAGSTQVMWLFMRRGLIQLAIGLTPRHRGSVRGGKDLREQ